MKPVRFCTSKCTKTIYKSFFGDFAQMKSCNGAEIDSVLTK